MAYVFKAKIFSVRCDCREGGPLRFFLRSYMITCLLNPRAADIAQFFLQIRLFY